MSSSELLSFMQRSAWPARSALVRFGAVAIFALLAGCEGEVTMDLTTELPADPNVDEVVASILGLEFVTSGGGTQTLEFRDSEELDFMDYSDDNNILRLFSSEELPEGNYTGVRLLFDADAVDDAFVTLLDGTQLPMSVVDGDYAPLSFSIDDDDSSSDSFTLMFDLRQSLSFDDDEDEYTLTPVLRAVDTGDAGSIRGTVNVTCPPADSLAQGAVYLFQGRDVVPDDVDGSGVEPFATAPVFRTQAGNSFFYALRFLPEGDYTLAVTCSGDDEDPVTDDDLRFRNSVNVGLDRGETLTRNVP